jgi:hypothetical protein
VSEDANALPKRARLDLLTQMTVDTLVAQFSAKHFVDANLEDIEADTAAQELRDVAELRDRKMGGDGDH